MRIIVHTTLFYSKYFVMFQPNQVIFRHKDIDENGLLHRCVYTYIFSERTDAGILASKHVVDSKIIAVE
jgi:hypothetical protein